MPDYNFDLISEEQKLGFAATHRYQCYSGGYGSGKTYLACLKLLFLAINFPGYRTAIVRKELNVLKKTTLQTFLKIAEPLIARFNQQEGILDLHNGSRFLFLGLDRFSEQDVKSLELNAAFIDQAEELDELIYNHLDTRLGRWDRVEVPEYLKDSLPKNPATGVPLAPTYLFVVCNPDTEYHWIYREFHPESLHWQENNRESHFFINMPSTSNNALNPDVLKTYMTKDEEFKRRYVMGGWGFSDAQIHRIPKESIIDPPNEFIQNFKKKALLYRTYDHGESSPSCCLWSACCQGIHIVYREYYMPGKLISFHRQFISDYSKGEVYNGSFADPEIFRKKAQRDGARYTTYDEYLDPNLSYDGKRVPSIHWFPADNNEFGTRNRINELLQLDARVRHPLTGEMNAPRIYFCKKNAENIQGCDHVIQQTAGQRREKLGELNGKTIWSEDRDKNVTDHAYDALRYYVAIHSLNNIQEQIKIPERSFAAFDKSSTRGRLRGIKTF
jgi:hypothetical protein